MAKNINQFAYIIILLIISINTQAQITLLESHKSDTTAYRNEHNMNDSILVFYYPNIQGHDIKPTLSATIKSMPDSLLNFRWSTFNFDNQTFEESGATDVNTTTSQIEDAASGGYRVLITNDFGNVDTSFTVWLNRQYFDIGIMEVERMTCDEITLDIEVPFEANFDYFNLTNNTQATWINSLKHTWTKNENLIDGINSSYCNDSAPTEETRYRIEVTDMLGYTLSNYFEIDETTEDNDGNLLLIAVDAKFSAIGPNDEYAKVIDTNEDALPDSSKITPFQAPFGLFVSNESSPTAQLFEWRFYDNNKSDLLKYSEEYQPVDSAYYKELPNPDEEGIVIYSENNNDSVLLYDVYIRVYGPESVLAQNDNNRCMDSIYAADFVRVQQSSFPENGKDNPLEMSNVFTPNDDNKNDFFYFAKGNTPKSIKYFSIKIYNRWGNKIYEFEDESGNWHIEGNSKPGWDGNTRFGGKVKPGVYYYSAKAIGHNWEEFESYGFFHVFY